MKRSCDFRFICTFILLVLFFVLFLIFFLFKPNSSENIDNTSKLWTSYDLSVAQIKNNLDIVMDYSSNDLTCGSLKNISIKDGSYESALNNLGCYITLYYYNLTEYNENYHNYLIKYRDKHFITKNDFISLKRDLKNDNMFYNYLKNMMNFKINDNEATKKINDIVSQFLNEFDVYFYDNCDNYAEVFSYKISELSFVAYVSYWLKNEYFNLNL